MSLKALSIFFRGLAVFVIIATIIPALTLEEWYVRIFDYPRLQIFILGLITLISILFLDLIPHRKSKILIVLLSLMLVIQAFLVFDYTTFGVKEVEDLQHSETDLARVSILAANVLMTNDNYQSLTDLVESQQPDLVLTMESDQKWQVALQKLEEKYPYTVKIPLDNTYGMHLYSKIPLQDTEVKYWVDKDIPSIHTWLRLNDSQMVELYCVHPKPPVPTESGNSRRRDAEVIIIANRVAESDHPVLVAGDFNDVAWSSITELFQKVSQLGDPRRGRGFYNTFNAEYPVMRWPLDHFFVSPHFHLVEMKRLPFIGSDHFPIMIEVALVDDHIDRPKRPVDSTVKELETQTIEEGLEDARKEEKK